MKCNSYCRYYNIYIHTMQLVWKICWNVLYFKRQYRYFLPRSTFSFPTTMLFYIYSVIFACILTFFFVTRHSQHSEPSSIPGIRHRKLYIEIPGGYHWPERGRPRRPEGTFSLLRSPKLQVNLHLHSTHITQITHAAQDGAKKGAIEWKKLSHFFWVPFLDFSLNW